MRIIIFLALCLAVYYVIKGYFKDLGLQRGQRPDSRCPPTITDELVQDPICGVYFPKKDALSLIWRGKTYYFCSEECRQKFREQNLES